MKDIQWDQVKVIFDATLQRPPGKRLAYLHQVCGNDKELLQELSTLLESHENSADFIDHPAIEDVATEIENEMAQLNVIKSLGHYEIIKQIGAGGMGEVYLAKDKKLDRQVAIKILNAEFNRHESNLQRFIKEAKAVSSLNHPNILVIHEIGEDNETNFIVSEFVEGKTLREIIKTETPDLKEILEIAIQTANAMTAAHATHLVHRDIKPENIMMRPDGLVKILDFGLAKLIAQKHQSLIGLEDGTIKQNETAQGIILGTVNYMSPEQAKGERVDERTDIFSFGAVIYEMLAGRTPFAGDSMSETFANLIKTEPPPLSLFSANVPDELQQIVSKTLRKNKTERYQTMKNLLADLKNLRENIAFDERLEKSYAPVAENATRFSSATTTGLNEQTAETGYGFTLQINRRKSFAVVTILLAGIVGATIFGFRQLTQIRQVNSAFQQVAFSRLTNNGKAKLVALSRDGNLIAYVTAEKEGSSLSVRQVGASNVINIVPPRKGEFVNITFSADGKLIYYTFFSGDKADAEFYSVPVLGGVIHKVPNFVTSIAPDGKHFVHPISSIGGDDETGLAIENFEGGAPRRLATRRLPEKFSLWGQVCSWSPNGEIIAAIGNSADEQGTYSTVVGVNVGNGAEKPLTAKRWNYINSVEWRRDGKGLLVVGSDQPATSNQIWFVSFPEGEARKLTNDLNDYSSLGVSPDGKLVVSVQATQTSSLWIGEAGSNSSGFKQIDSETGVLSPIDLTSDNQLIFRSSADGKSNLWTMRTDGGERRQLTADAQADMRGICVTPDAKRIVFVSSLAGAYDLWRVDVDGGNLTRLTSGDGEMFPACSPDNQFVIYQKSLGARIGKALWRISLNGGQQIPLTDYYAIRPAISPDGRRVAFFYMSDEKWRIGIVSANGGLMEQSFDVPDNVPDRIIRWAQNNRDLFYAANIGDVGNVWQLSPDGKTRQITDFDSNLLDAFALSPNAKKMAITRTASVSDVVGIAEQP